MSLLLYQHCFIDDFDKKCFEFSASGVTESSTILESDRQYGDGIARNGQLYMIGGKGDAEMSMEHVAPGETVQSGPAMESQIKGPCVVKLDDNLIFMIGGFANR